MKPAATGHMAVLRTGEPIEIPGTVLNPGVYVLRVAGSEEAPNVARVLNLIEVLDESETRVIAKIYSFPDFRPPSGRQPFKYYDLGPGRPKALSSWFHSSESYGEQFLYSSGQAATIAAATGQTILSVPFEAAAAGTEADTKADTEATDSRGTLFKAAASIPAVVWLMGLGGMVVFLVIRFYPRGRTGTVDARLMARNYALARKVAASAYQNYKLSRSRTPADVNERRTPRSGAPLA